MQATNSNGVVTPHSVAAKSDVGLIRSNNEDHFSADPKLGLLVLCDGMGGANAGEVASEIGVATVLGFFREAREAGHFPPFEIQNAKLSQEANALGEALQQANRRIRKSAADDPKRRGMGSTMVAAYVHDGVLAIANVGDSRIYRIRSEGIEQLTEDHSLVMEHVRRGHLTLEEAGYSKLQNVITRALGADDVLVPDLEDVVLKAGDCFLLCSDGLTRGVSDEQIFAIVRHAASLDEACEQLISAANEAGGEDNVTCILAAF